MESLSMGARSVVLHRWRPSLGDFETTIDAMGLGQGTSVMRAHLARRLLPIREKSIKLPTAEEHDAYLDRSRDAFRTKNLFAGVRPCFPPFRADGDGRRGWR